MTTFLGRALLAIQAAGFRGSPVTGRRQPTRSPVPAVISQHDRLDVSALVEGTGPRSPASISIVSGPGLRPTAGADGRAGGSRSARFAYGQRLLAAGARRVNEMPVWQKFALGRRWLSITEIPEISPMWDDVAIVPRSTNGLIAHSGDARPT